jgi:hypothetical protein
MQTSRFQLGLIATLAVGLGFSLSSSEAVGYPAGAVVSMGANPVLSKGGSFTVGSSATALAGPSDSDQVIVVTDFTVSTDTNDWDCLDRIPVVLTVDGETVGHVAVSTPFLYQHYLVDTASSSAVLQLSSGIRVPAGSTLTVSNDPVLSTTPSSCWASRTVNIRYTLSGYYSQA